MKTTSTRIRYIAFFCFLWGQLCQAQTSLIGKSVNDFSLKSTEGKMVSLSQFPDAKGFIIIFTCNHCPFAKLYPERMNALQNKYAKLGIPLLAISSTDTLIYEEDVFSEMVTKKENEHFNFLYLQDGSQEVAKNFGAQKTPHAFVIWKEKGARVIKYSGAIDDNGAQPENVNHPFVAEAIDALLQGKTVTTTETRSIGCTINFRGQAHTREN